MNALEPSELLEKLIDAGFRRAAGVPCSTLAGLFDTLEGGRIPYANAPNEGEALAYAAGSWLGGEHAAVICQNSGLGNLYNALTSLLATYRIPALLLCGFRGAPPFNDEPQHQLMGAISASVLQLAEARLTTVRRAEELLRFVDDSPARMARRDVPAALIEPGVVLPSGGAALAPASRRARPAEAIVRRSPILAARSSLCEAIDALAPYAATTAVIATTGYIGRRYCADLDGPNAFYMSGSMGHAPALALGASAASGRPTLVLDGDGAILMRLSSLPFVGSEAPARFVHVVLDNGVHGSTGGQHSLSAHVDLAAIAAAAGYRTAVDTGDPAEAHEAVTEGLRADGPVFIRLRISPQEAAPPRIVIPPAECALRFRRFLASNGG